MGVQAIDLNPPHTTIVEDCVCAFCGNNREFELPDELVERAIKGELVIFAGAGISTESKSVFPRTFYEERAYDLGVDPHGETSFPDMMETYVKKFGRRSLLQEIKKRLDYVDSFEDVKWASTRFHRELSTIPHIREIVTTNWDTLFEDITDATPIVTALDYAFWDLPGRKVFKIHGSMSNVGTIVATATDYASCYKSLREGAIGASLKHMLATKTLVFVGYSFRDTDFKRIYNYIQKEMGDLIPRSYVVTTSSARPDAVKNSQIVQTDGTYFIRQLKERLVTKDAMLPDDRFETIDALQYWASDAHQELIEFDSFSKFPELAFTASYQEGLLHALGRIKVKRKTGEYSDEHHIGHMLYSYNRLLKGAIRAKRYYDAAYIDGYVNGLLCLVVEDFAETVPVFYLYGYKDRIDSMEELKSLIGKGRTTKSALKFAERMMKNQVGNLQPVHTSFLDGVEPV